MDANRPPRGTSWRARTRPRRVVAGATGVTGGSGEPDRPAPGAHSGDAEQPGVPEHFTVRVPTGYRVGCWEVCEPIASGAFGSVYAARRLAAAADTGLPATAALKFLPTGTQTPRQLRHLAELADRELALYRRLQRPRLLRMWETRTVDDPAAPELDGATVLVLERAARSLEGALAEGDGHPLPDAAQLLHQICEGLAQLHDAGWVHGDLKPSNVLLLADGSVRLADFNLAAELEGTHAYAPAFATPDYAPPELLDTQITERGRHIRTTADLWAFGVLAHLVLTGTLPWPGSTPAARRDAALRYAAGQDELRLAPQLDENWRQLISGCLSPNHRERAPHTAHDLLERIAAPTPKPTRQRWRRMPWPRTRRAAGSSLAGAMALAGAFGYVLTTGNSSSTDGSSGGSDPAARYGAAELRTDAGVPARYRELIVDAAHSCEERDVSPPLIAALLKAESNFNPKLADPKEGDSGEYGIARWSPHVLPYYVPAADRPKGGGSMRPPFPPRMSIPAVGRYLCEIAPRLYPDLPGDRRVLIAAAYRTSREKVNEAGGIPDKQRAYAERVRAALAKYTPKDRT